MMFRKSHQPALKPVTSADPNESCFSCLLIIGKKYRLTAKLDNKHIQGSPMEIITEDKDRKPFKDHNKVTSQNSPRMETYYRELLTNTLHKCLAHSSQVNFLQVKKWTKVFDIPNVIRRNGDAVAAKQSCEGKIAVEMPIGICLLTDWFVVSTFKGRFCIL